ncbi:Transcription factor bHLH90 [Linum perenne]
MAGELESVIGLLRPIVDCRAWDYCVVWKSTSNPSRFLEWIGCCCSGATNGGSVTETDSVVKQEDGAEVIGPFCRDVNSRHPITSMACHALARFPSFLPLYPGVRGAAAVSIQSSWIHTDSQTHFESGGTRVLIPVIGGLVELFTAEHVPEDDRIVDLIVTHCNTLLYGLIMKEQGLDPSILNEFKEFQSPSYSSSSLDREFLSSISTPRSVYPLLDMSYGAPSVNATSASSSGQPKLAANSAKKQDRSLQGLNTKVEKPGRNRPKSKNLMMERNRRNKIQQRLFSLRALVPKISKMDKASIIGDAIDYIIELQNERKTLEEELVQLEEEEKESRKVDTELKNISSNLPLAAVKTEMTEAELDVIHIGQREYLIKLLYHQKKGGLVKLMETLSSLGLQVVDANITNFHGSCLNILRVQGNRDISQRKLRNTLIKLT